MSSPLILANRIAQWVAKEPQLDVLTFVNIEAGGRLADDVVNYQRLWNNGQKLAQWLKNQGMKKGDAFAIVMSNHPEFVELMIASSILGTVFVPIDPRAKGQKLRFMMEFVECKGIVVADYALDNVLPEWPITDNAWMMTLGSAAKVKFESTSIELVNAGVVPAPFIPVASDDVDAPMQILFTSGTTGDPKAIVSSHRRFGEVSQIADVLGLTRADRPYTGLSLTHANAQLVTLGNVLAHGMRGVISRKFTKSRLWDITRQYGCTFFNLLGGMTTAIYAELPKPDDADNPVRRVLSAGMPAAIWEDFAKRFGVELFEFYGAAEGGMTFNPPGGPVGSCGLAPPSLEMKLFNDQGHECAAGEAGEICFRNADQSALDIKYFKNPEASAEKNRGGWLRMGDIGHVDGDGWLYFHYRKGGGIRRNGDFVNTAFVEKALSEIDTIDDVFVYGVPATNGAPGEKDVVAAIVLAAGVELDAASIFSQCQQKLERNFVPSFLHLVDAIPKTASEKPQERFLLDAFDADADFIVTEADLAK